MDNLKAIVEGIVFVSESPVGLKKLKGILKDVEGKEIIKALDDLVEEYDKRNGALCLVEVAGGFQFRTKDNFSPWIRKLTDIKPVAISQAAMETLAVVAYKQPVMKAEIEKVRGVDVSGTLKGLLKRNLIRMIGRKDVPGRPIIYGTTKKFLEVFSLKDLSELPTLRELKELGE
ncbi:MAG: SMC-Scp complex subunit ScpB [Syntrophobacterales bacterium]|nr:SMC-Scp complex subunit ScpB [Syntrophobacterales bacterium]